MIRHILLPFAIFVLVRLSKEASLTPNLPKLLLVPDNQSAGTLSVNSPSSPISKQPNELFNEVLNYAKEKVDELVKEYESKAGVVAPSESEFTSTGFELGKGSLGNVELGYQSAKPHKNEPAEEIKAEQKIWCSLKIFDLYKLALNKNLLLDYSEDQKSERESAKLQALGEVNRVLNEIKILIHLPHSKSGHTVRLITAYHYSYRIVIVEDFVEGRSMWNLFKTRKHAGALKPQGDREHHGYLNETEAKKYIAMIIVLLYWLEEHDFEYPDLKPDNLLIRRGGLLTLADFDYARNLKASTGVSEGIRGTLFYMSPQVIETGKRKFDMSDSMWTVGAIAAEMLIGDPLFIVREGGGSEKVNKVETIKKITGARHPAFKPTFPISAEAFDAINSFLHEDPTKRPTIQSVISENKLVWFNDIDWEEYINRKNTPPIEPILVESGAQKFKEFEGYRVVKAGSKNTEGEEDSPHSQLGKMSMHEAAARPS